MAPLAEIPDWVARAFFIIGLSMLCMHLFPARWGRRWWKR